MDANGERSVIFTYWISTLDIIERIFQQKAISFRRIDGTLSTPQRTERLSHFHQDSSVRILMMTLGTGAVGYVIVSSSEPKIM